MASPEFVEVSECERCKQERPLNKNGVCKRCLKDLAAIRKDPFLRKKRLSQLNLIENGTLRSVAHRMAIESSQAPAVRKMSWPKLFRERDARKSREAKERDKVDRLFAHFQQKNIPELIFASLVSVAGKTDEGQIVAAVSVPWMDILREIDKDPNFLFQFVNNPTGFEELIAGAYRHAGWPHVILTPRSADKGRDIIVSKPGFGAIRFLEQTKAYRPGHLVTHGDVRAMLGVLAADNQASKALITTTSGFQPTVMQSQQFVPFMPNRFELKDGPQTVKWLREIASGALRV